MLLVPVHSSKHQYCYFVTSIGASIRTALFGNGPAFLTEGYDQSTALFKHAICLKGMDSELLAYTMWRTATIEWI
jgi:hypothetical protein